VSSGAIIPARAPASIDMLQTVIRCSIDSPRIAGPALLDHVTGPAPHADLRDDPQDEVLRRHPGMEPPLDLTASVLGRP